MNYYQDKKVLITGSTGYIGSALKADLIKLGANVSKISGLSILEGEAVNSNTGLGGYDIIFHLAAYVGGIKKTSTNQMKALISNGLMLFSLYNQINHIPSSQKPKKIILASSACSYPTNAVMPMNEERLHDGPPNSQVYGYGYAKRLMSVFADLSPITTTLILTNVYGVYNNSCESFDPVKSHVTGALVKKIVDAVEGKSRIVELWGNGSPTRDFVHVHDVVNAFLLAGKLRCNGSFNIGSGNEITIKDLAGLLKVLTRCKAQLLWNTSQPSGSPRRCLDITTANEILGWYPKVEFESGLKEEIEWYKNQH